MKSKKKFFPKLTLIGLSILLIGDVLMSESKIKSFFGQDLVMSTAAIGKSTVSNSKAIFETVSTTKGSLPAPSMTSTQRDAISAPTTGLMIFNNTTSKYNMYNGVAWVEVGSGAGGIYAAGTNLFSNNSWETDTTNWTASGGSYARNTTVDHIIPPGVGSASFDPSASSQTLTATSTTITSTDGLSGRNGVMSCAIKTAATDMIMQVYDGTNVLNAVTISSPSGFVRHSINFVFPSSGTITGRFISASNSAVAYIDDCFLGLAENFNTYNVSQAELYGRITVSGCTANWSRSNTSYGTLGTQTGCSYSAVGNASAPSTNLAAIKFNSLPPGNYHFVARSNFYKSVTTTNSSIGYRFTDGTNNFGENIMHIGSSSGQAWATNMITAFMQYTTAQSNITFEIQGKTSTTSSSTNVTIGDDNNSESDSTVNDLEIDVFRFPLSSETGFKPDQIAWYVDANISGANISLGTSNQSSYIEMTNSGLTLTNNSGSATAQIACASGTASTGTTCSVNESNGIAFTIPKAGTYEACASFGHYVQLSAATYALPTFQVVETTNTSSAVVQEGKDRIPSQPGGVSAAASFVGTNSLKVCSILTFASSGQKTLRLEYEQTIVGTPTNNDILADGATTNGQQDIHWTVRPWLQNTPAPLLVNSVVSTYSGVDEIRRALISNNGTPSISAANNPGTWITGVTDTATGRTTVTWTAFASAPVCTCVTTENVTSGTNCGFSGNPTTTGVEIRTRDMAGNLADNDIHLICVGAK